MTIPNLLPHFEADELIIVEQQQGISLFKRLEPDKPYSTTDQGIERIGAWASYKYNIINDKVTLIDFTLPSDLALGTYCLHGILSPQGENPLAVRDKWVSNQQCFEVMS